MSETIRCAHCDTLLYFGEEIKRRLYMRAIPSEETVLSLYHNVCPHCGNVLSLSTVKIDFRRRRVYASR